MTRQLTVERDRSAGRVAAAARSRRSAGSATPRFARGAPIGGSLAHADPAAELPAVAVCLDAQLHCRRTARSAHGRRRGLLHGLPDDGRSSPTRSWSRPGYRDVARRHRPGLARVRASPRRLCPGRRRVVGRSTVRARVDQRRAASCSPASAASPSAPAKPRRCWSAARCPSAPRAAADAVRAAHRSRRRHPRLQGVPHAPGGGADRAGASALPTSAPWPSDPAALDVRRTLETAGSLCLSDARDQRRR